MSNQQRMTPAKKAVMRSGMGMARSMMPKMGEMRRSMNRPSLRSKGAGAPDLRRSLQNYA